MKQSSVRRLCALLLLPLLAACTPSSPTPDSETTPPATTAPAPAEFAVIENGQSAFTLVRADLAPDSTVKSTTNFYRAIAEQTGVTLEINTDFYREGSPCLDPASPQILVGETNRTESLETLAALPAHSYTVRTVGNQLVILGTSPDLTALALIEFDRRILQNPDTCADGKLILRPEDEFTVTLDAPLSMKDKITGKYSLVCLTEQTMTVDRVGDCYAAQGACSDGTYAYFVMRRADDSGAVIAKHTLADGKRVAVSEVLTLGHGNDMTYDSKRGCLVVCTDDDTIATVDPETLTILARKTIAKPASGITYSPKRDWYAVSKSGRSVDFFDGEWNFQVGTTRTDKTGYVVQGMGSDEDYLYFILSAPEGKKDNRLIVYSWAGGHVATLEIPVSHEGESMFFVNDTYYIAYHRAGLGPVLYKTEFAVVYE